MNRLKYIRDLQGVIAVINCPDARGMDGLVLLTVATYAPKGGGECNPSIDTIAARAKIKPTTVRASLKRLTAAGLIQIRHKEGHSSILTITIPTPPQMGSPLTRPQMGSDPSPIRTEPLPISALTPPQMGSQKEVLKEIEKETLKESDASLHLKAFFEEFWELYPRKRSKEPAWNVFQKLVAVEKADPSVIVEGARQFAEDPDLPADRFVPYPARWLSDKRWTDYEDDVAEVLPPFPPYHYDLSEPWGADVNGGGQ